MPSRSPFVSSDSVKSIHRAVSERSVAGYKAEPGIGQLPTRLIRIRLRRQTQSKRFLSFIVQGLRMASSLLGVGIIEIKSET